MTIELTPELGVELTPDIDYLDLRERAEALCRSILLLEQHGLDTEATPEDKEVAAKLTSAYAQDPTRTSKLVNNERASTLTPASLQNIRAYLDEYGRSVVTHAVELRHMVTNRLIEESQNPDPRIRIRALELLGKHSDVGLFSERSEVTVTHQTTDELKEKLRAKLQKLVRKNKAEEAGAIEDATVREDGPLVRLGNDVIDIDAELGLSDRPAPEVFEPEDDVDPENPDAGDDRA